MSMRRRDMRANNTPWYILLEQGRAERPSPSMLDTLCASLRLADIELLRER
jgi:hypothetical protein